MVRTYASLDSSGEYLVQSPLRKLTNQSIAVTETTIAHGLGTTPAIVIIVPRGVSFVYESTAADATNIYLTAAGATTCDVYLSVGSISGPTAETQFPSVLLQEMTSDGSDFSNPAADYRRLFLGEDGRLHVRDSAGAVTDIAALGAWTNYTPTWTGGVTNPTLGSTTIVGRYKYLDAKTVIVQISIVITTGGAWNAGSGQYGFSLPSITAASGREQVGSAHVLDAGTTHYSATTHVGSGGTTIDGVLVGDASGAKTLSHNVPVTWATGDSINMSIVLEIA